MAFTFDSTNGNGFDPNSIASAPQIAPPSQTAGITPGYVDPGLIAAARRNAQAAGIAPTRSEPMVPLWQNRPKNGDPTVHINAGQRGIPFGGRMEGSRTTYQRHDGPVPQSQAQSYFLDMPQGDRQKFVEKAVQLGLLRPDSSGYIDPNRVYSLWQEMVSRAADYNSVHQDTPSKWISPWEALNRSALSELAKQNGSVDLYAPKTTTTTTNKQFNSGDISSTMEQIWQAEVGRKPTKAEISAMTQTVQAAYDANPQIQKTVTTPSPSGDTSVVQTISGGIDQNQIMMDQAQNSPEAAAYQAGALLLPAALQAIGAVA